MDFDILRQLITILEESSLAELEVEEDQLRVRLKKPEERVQIQHAAPAPMVSPGESAGESKPAPPPPPEPIAEETLVTIDSPMVGVFYASPAPGEAPYASPGDIIEEGQTVCIVEAMKLMNEVSAKYRARIERVLVENGEPVEFGQALYAVTPLES